MNEDKEKMIYMACKMYETAGNLFSAQMVADANSLATKAKALLDKALEGTIEKA